MLVRDTPSVKNAVERVLCAALPYIEAKERTPKDIAIEVQGYFCEIMQSTVSDLSAEFPIAVTDEGMVIILFPFDNHPREFHTLETFDPAVTIRVNDDDEWMFFVFTWDSDDKMFLPDDHALRLAQLQYWLDYPVED